jgi:hypothetical protein
MRGSLTALESDLELLEDRHAAELDASGRALLDAAAANGQWLSGLVEALALVAGRGAGRPVAARALLGDRAARWQGFLSRAGLALNLVGEPPDTPLDGRSAGVVVGLLVALGAETLGRAGGRLELSAEDRGADVMATVTLVGPSAGRKAVEAALLASTAPGRLAGLALAAALDSLGATLTCEPDAGVGRAALRVLVPARGSE